MDQTDLRILRDMGYIPFLRAEVHDDPLKPGAIARRLGLNPELVRERMAAMERLGVLAGYQVYPNLRHLGLHQVTFHYEMAEERKAGLSRDLETLDGVQSMMDYVGADVCIDMVYRTQGELERRRQWLGRLTGDERHQRIYQAPTPAVPSPLSLLDWKIVRGLRGNARRPLQEVADELNVSVRTVKRRFDRMLEERSIDILPNLDPSRIPGAIPFELLIHVAPATADETIAQLMHAFDDCFVIVMRPPGGELCDVVFVLTASSPKAMEDLRRQAEAVPGVTRARVVIPCGATYFHSWADEAIEAKIGELSGYVSEAEVTTPQNRHASA